MQRSRKLFFRDKHATDIFLRVEPIIHRGFGVFANNLLIAIHNDRATADAHCQRLRDQQALG
jgi:hypothetical protein